MYLRVSSLEIPILDWVSECLNWNFSNNAEITANWTQDLPEAISLRLESFTLVRVGCSVLHAARCTLYSSKCTAPQSLQELSLNYLRSTRSLENSVPMVHPPTPPDRMYCERLAWSGCARSRATCVFHWACTARETTAGLWSGNIP